MKQLTILACRHKKPICCCACLTRRFKQGKRKVVAVLAWQRGSCRHKERVVAVLAWQRGSCRHQKKFVAVLARRGASGSCQGTKMQLPWMLALLLCIALPRSCLYHQGRTAPRIFAAAMHPMLHNTCMQRDSQKWSGVPPASNCCW